MASSGIATVEEAETATLVAAMTSAPTGQRRGQINSLIAALKTAGIWTKTDVLYVFAAHDSQAARLNWKNPGTFTCTAINSPTFTTDRGFTGDGATSYLDTGHNPTTAGLSFVRDNAHQAVWLGTPDATSVSQLNLGNIASRMGARSASTHRTRPNATSDTDFILDSSSLGWTCWSRNNSANVDGVRNLDAPVNVARASAALSNLPFYVGAFATTGPAASSFSTRRNQAAHWGVALTDTERDAYYNALLTYMQGVGAA